MCTLHNAETEHTQHIYAVCRASAQARTLARDNVVQLCGLNYVTWWRRRWRRRRNGHRRRAIAYRCQHGAVRARARASFVTNKRHQSKTNARTFEHRECVCVCVCYTLKMLTYTAVYGLCMACECNEIDKHSRCSVRRCMCVCMLHMYIIKNILNVCPPHHNRCTYLTTRCWLLCGGVRTTLTF